MKALRVVSSNPEKIKDAVKDRSNGILIKHDDHQKFASTIVELLASEDYRQDFGRKAKLFVEQNYTWPGIAERYMIEFEKSKAQQLNQ